MHEKPQTPSPTALPEALVHAARTHNMRRIILSDALTGADFSYRLVLLRAFALSRYVRRAHAQEQNIAVLLPTTPASAIVFFALQFAGKIPAMLNASAGQRNLKLACETAAARTIFTSRAFVQKAELGDVVEALSATSNVVFLEDVKGKIGLADKLTALVSSRFPEPALARLKTDVNDPAVILFTSGSEGVPKGVALSHANILANVSQVTERIEFSLNDRMFNALPIFHSFGLSVGTLLPMLLGVRAFLYPSPLHYKQIPPLVGKARATIFLGTDTFYNGYAKYASAEDFQTLRLCVAGAEKLKDSTREMYLQRFGVDIFQGYGVTEASPVISCNTPTAHKPGTVGRIFPRMEWKLEPVEGLTRGGRLLVSGPNIMLGYMRHTVPGIIEPQSGYYDTGDVVEIDAEGYITILGRAKRFAKIGGEMVSLASVEDVAAELWPEAAHAALAMPDERKGEQIWLITEQASATREALLAFAQTKGYPEIALPRKIQVMESIPRLGSGKVDYMALKQRITEQA